MRRELSVCIRRTASAWLASALVVTGTAAAQDSQRSPASGAPTAEAAAHALEAPLRLARASRDAAGKLEDFEATFHKRELVGRTVIPLVMEVKFRTKPASTYLRFGKPHEGREVIYVEGKNGGRLLAHETGFKGLIGTVSLVPTSAEAMSEGRYPITMMGMAKMAEGIITLWEAELAHEAPQVKYLSAKLAGMDCDVIESMHPVQKRNTAFHRTRLYIDRKTGLPVRVEQNAFPQRPGGQPPLVEEYTYSNIRTNVGLKDIDFDTRNPKYGF